MILSFCFMMKNRHYYKEKDKNQSKKYRKKFNNLTNQQICWKIIYQFSFEKINHFFFFLETYYFFKKIAFTQN